MTKEVNFTSFLFQKLLIGVIIILGDRMEEVKYDDINDLDWPDVPIKSVQFISNIEKRKEYIKKIKMCYSKVINPLSDLISQRSFNFSVSDEQLTCRLMVNEIEEELKKQNYTKEDLKEIVIGNIK